MIEFPSSHLVLFVDLVDLSVSELVRLVFQGKSLLPLLRTSAQL
jgi:hypothetical protein